METNIGAKIAFTGSKRSTCFQEKDKRKFQHNNDIVFHGTFPKTDCSENYIAKTTEIKIIQVKILKIIQVNMSTCIFLNVHLKVNMKY